MSFRQTCGGYKRRGEEKLSLERSEKSYAICFFIGQDV